MLPIMGCANGKAYGSAMDDPHAKDPAVTDDWECKAEALRLFNLVRALPLPFLPSTHNLCPLTPSRRRILTAMDV